MTTHHSYNHRQRKVLEHFAEYFNTVPTSWSLQQAIDAYLAKLQDDGERLHIQPAAYTNVNLGSHLVEAHQTRLTFRPGTSHEERTAALEREHHKQHTIP